MRLLIADDDASTRRTLSRILRTLGHEVVETTSTRTAVGQLTRGRFDLIFTELKSPRNDGLQLVRAARVRSPSAPVVVLVAPTDVDSAVDALNEGARAYLEKPVRSERVSGLLRGLEGGTVAASSLAVGDAELAEVERGVGFVPSVAESALATPLGLGRLESAAERGGRVQKVLRIDGTGAPANLLGRLLVGSYITGQDQVLVTSRRGFTPAQRKEIHRTADRILGMSVVGDTPTLLEIQNFVDPQKYELPRLLHRVVEMLESELAACLSALSGTEWKPLDKVKATEEEIDRFYLLMVRQLLLSSDNPRIARSIDVESHHYQLGYRLVAKVLEVTGDLIHGTASELDGHLQGLRAMPRSASRQLVGIFRRVQEYLSRTMDAFQRLSVVDANATLNAIARSLPKDSTLGDVFARHISDRKVAIAAQRIVSNLVMSMEMLVIVNEVTINRSVEPETVAHTGTRVPLGHRSGRSLPPGP